MKKTNLLLLLNLVSTYYEHSDLQELNSLKSPLIYKMLTVLNIELKENKLSFRKSFTEYIAASDLLEQDKIFSDFILFTKKNKWYAEEQSNSANFIRMLDFKETEDSERIGVVCASLLRDGEASVQIWQYKGTTLLCIYQIRE